MSSRTTSPPTTSTEHAADRIGVDRRALTAVIAVESSGVALQHGRPVIRLEVHHLWRNVPTDLRSQVDERFVVRGPKPWEGHEWRPAPRATWEPLHVGQEREWRAYTLARGIHAHAAIRATSWGLGQVLGLHWQRCGYASPEAFESAQSTEAGQIDTMAGFIAGDGALVAALRAHDWRGFARGYNGDGQVDVYAGRLVAAYARASAA